MPSYGICGVHPICPILNSIHTHWHMWHYVCHDGNEFHTATQNPALTTMWRCNVVNTPMHLTLSSTCSSDILVHLINLNYREVAPRKWESTANCMKYTRVLFTLGSAYSIDKHLTVFHQRKTVTPQISPHLHCMAKFARRRKFIHWL